MCLCNLLTNSMYACIHVLTVILFQTVHHFVLIDVIFTKTAIINLIYTTQIMSNHSIKRYLSS